MDFYWISEKVGKSMADWNPAEMLAGSLEQKDLMTRTVKFWSSLSTALVLEQHCNSIGERRKKKKSQEKKNNCFRRNISQ